MNPAIARVFAGERRRHRLTVALLVVLVIEAAMVGFFVGQASRACPTRVPERQIFEPDDPGETFPDAWQHRVG